MKKLRLAILSIIIAMLATATQSCCKREESLEKYKGWQVIEIKPESSGFITVTIDSVGELKKVYTKTFFKTKYPVGSIIGEIPVQSSTDEQSEDKHVEQPIENESEPETTQE